MDKRLKLIKENKRKEKNAEKKSVKRFNRIFILFLIVGCLNWVFWHDQFLGLDFKYNLFFVIIPFLIGLIVFLTNNVSSIKPVGYIRSAVSYGFLFLIGAFFSYLSFVTIANVLFKVGMDFSVNDKPTVTKTYIVESTVRNNFRSGGIHLFSTIYYLDANNKTKIFYVGVDDVTTSHEKQKITFKCQKGFWDYYKILDYKME